MERNSDLRKATVAAVNGLPRKRQRITTFRDSTDQDTQMELQETVRLGDREQLQNKDQELELPKRRRIDRSAALQRSDGGESCRENESTDSSDEEYYEKEEEMRMHHHSRINQFSPTSSSLSNNRRALRTLRSSPLLRAAADEMFCGPVPRRARSSSAKRLQEYSNSGSGGFVEDMSHRRFSPSPEAVNLIGFGDPVKKMKSLERRTPISNPKQSVIQDDIEIEVAEALFDLAKQSQSQSQSSERQENVDRDGVNTASDELTMSKADGFKDENNAFSVQKEPSIKVDAETNMADSMKELKKGRVEKDKFSDDPAQELVSGDGFVNKVEVGSQKESESPSCVKVNACDIQDPTVTKAHYDAIIVEAKKETKLDIDLMASPLPSSPEGEGLVDVGTDPGAISQAVRKKSEIVRKDDRLTVVSVMQGQRNGVMSSEQQSSGMQGERNGVMSSDQQSNLDVEKHNHNNTQQQLVRKEHKSQPPTSLLPFHIGTSNWPGFLPHPGFMPPQQAMPLNGSPKSSMIMQPPQFKFSQPRPKRCATHQYLAQSIRCHQQLIKKSLSAGSTGSTALCGSKSPSLKYTPPAQNYIHGNPFLAKFQGAQNLATGKDKNSDAATKSLLQQASHPASASNFLHGHGYMLPYGHHQTTVMAPTISSGSPQSATSAGNATYHSNSAGRLPVNIPLPNTSNAMSLNHPVFPSNEAAASYLAMLQNNGCPIPIPTNIAMPTFKGGSPSIPFFNPSMYPSSQFNITQNQQHFTTSHVSAQSASQNTNLSSHKQSQYLQPTSAKTCEKKFPSSVTLNSQLGKLVRPSHLSSKSDAEINWKDGASVAPAFVSHSVKPNTSQPMNYEMFPSASLGGGAAGNKQTDTPQQGSKGRVEVIPQAFAFSFGSNASATPVLNFSSMGQTSAMFPMLPDMSRNGNQMMHQKNFQSSEGKPAGSGCHSFNYSRSDCPEISPLPTMGPPKFDGSARNVNFYQSSLTGSQPFPTSTGVSVTIPNFQQHQLIQVQDHQHTHQMRMAGNGQQQVKPSTPHNIPGSFFGGMPLSSSPMFAQVSALNETPLFHPKWENFPRSLAPEGSQHHKSSQGQTHINFGNGPISATSFQGHQLLIKSESSSNSSMSKNTVSSQRNASALGLAASTSPPLPSQETEASQGGASQKSSPACRRNVPSILSACPSQLPELKY